MSRPTVEICHEFSRKLAHTAGLVELLADRYMPYATKKEFAKKVDENLSRLGELQVELKEQTGSVGCMEMIEGMKELLAPVES